MTKFVAPVTRENLHKFKEFIVVHGRLFVATGTKLKLHRDNGSLCPFFMSDRGEFCLFLDRLAGIVDDDPAVSTTDALHALDDAERAISVARKALMSG